MTGQIDDSLSGDKKDDARARALLDRSITVGDLHECEKTFLFL